MTIKTLFTMVEQANAFNELVGEEKRNYIGIRIDNMFSLSDDNDNKRFYTFKEFKRVLKENLIKEECSKFLEADLQQEEQYKNYFNFSNYEVGIFEN